MSKLEENAPELIRQGKMSPGCYPDDHSKALGYLMRNCLDDKDVTKIDPAYITQVIKDVMPDETKNMSLVDIANAIGADALTNMGQAMEPHINDVMINMGEAGIADGSRIDSRNAAMSAVADLLHMPHVIARSRPMVLRDKNGNEIQGTFIAEAKGEDVTNLSPQAAKIDAAAFSITDGKGFKDIADLQMLDFICGNVDRHYGNMFYQFNKNNRLTGVQGIDNDCSFGTYVPKDGESQKRLAGLFHMRAVSESTNEREARETLARRLGDKAEEKDYRNREKPVQQPVLQ